MFVPHRLLRILMEHIAFTMPLVASHRLPPPYLWPFHIDRTFLPRQRFAAPSWRTRDCADVPTCEELGGGLYQYLFIASEYLAKNQRDEHGRTIGMDC